MNSQYLIYIFLVILSFLLTYKLVPKVIYFCSKYNLKEVPNERKEHVLPMPRLGGFSLILGSFLTIIFLILINFGYEFIELELIKLLNLMLCSILIYILGSIDDLYNLRAYPRLIGQFVVALLAYYMGFRIECVDLSFFGQFEYVFCLPNILSLIITTFWIVGIINSINWIDGIDGLAALLISISALSFGFISLNSGQFIPAIFAFTTLGSTLAFLRYNYFPAKIFMGDGGSYFLGFNIAIISIISQSSGPIIFNPFRILFLLGIPFIDMVRVILIRIIKGNSPFLPDRSHYHYKLVNLGFSHKKIFVSSFLINSFLVFIGLII